MQIHTSKKKTKEKKKEKKETVFLAILIICACRAFDLLVQLKRCTSITKKGGTVVLPIYLVYNFK